MTQEPDLFEARQLKDAGIASAASGAREYFSKALDKMNEWRWQNYPEEPFCMEEIMMELVAILGPMPSKYVPGSLTQNAIKRRMIVATGTYRQSPDKKKKAHRNPIYRWNVYS